MTSLTPEQRVQRARAAVLTRWSRTDEAGRTAATEPARQGLRAKFAREIDPDGTLPPAELERRIGWAMKAHMRGSRCSHPRLALPASRLRPREVVVVAPPRNSQGAAGKTAPQPRMTTSGDQTSETSAVRVSRTPDSGPGVDRAAAPVFTSAERREVIALAKAKAKNGVQRVKAAGAARLVELLRQLDAQFEVEDAAIAAKMPEIEKLIADVNDRLNRWASNAGIFTAARPSVEFRYWRGGVATNEDRKRLREQVKAENDAAVEAAITTTESWVIEVTEDLLMAGLTADGAREFIATLPAAEDLLPPADPQTVLSVEGAQPAGVHRLREVEA